MDETPLPVEVSFSEQARAARIALHADVRKYVIWFVVFILSVLAGSFFYTKMIHDKLQQEAVDACAPNELFDIARIGGQNYAVCESDVKYDMKPLN